MAANRQTYIHTHARAQCSHASVGLAQARPNKDCFPHNIFLVINYLHEYHKWVSLRVLALVPLT